MKFIQVPALIAALFCTSVAAQVLPPQTSFQGSSASELAAAWWQWAVAAPSGTSPIRDLSGVHCGVGQEGDLWFLAGGIGTSKIRRVCAIPANKALFFPIINMVYWPRQESTASSCENAKQSAALNNDTAVDLFAEIDGRAVEDLRRYRAATEKCFDLYARVPASERSHAAPVAATDGYWLLIAPLPKGRHVLKFGGRYNRESASYGKTIQDIEYELLVE